MPAPEDVELVVFSEVPVAASESPDTDGEESPPPLAPADSGAADALELPASVAPEPELPADELVVSEALSPVAVWLEAPAESPPLAASEPPASALVSEEPVVSEEPSLEAAGISLEEDVSLALVAVSAAVDVGWLEVPAPSSAPAAEPAASEVVVAEAAVLESPPVVAFWVGEGVVACVDAADAWGTAPDESAACWEGELDVPCPADVWEAAFSAAAFWAAFAAAEFSAS